LDHRQAPASSSKVQEVTEAARSNLSDGEFQELEDLIAEYEDIFATGSEDYGRTDRPISSVALGYPENYIVTRVATLSLVCYRRFYNAWE
jgi:hypothetical protein